MTETKKYNFSFTGFSLRENEMLKVAEAISKRLPIEMVDFGDGNRNTGQRRLVAIKRRLKQFSEQQFQLFMSGDLNTRKKLAFLSVCKAHAFIREFVVEVLREKLLVYDYEISEGDYISFYRRKFEYHPEMELLTEQTEYKIRQVTFKILEQAGIINDVRERLLQPQLLSPEIVQVIVSDNEEWLKVFMLSDEVINNIS
ncbi:MAG: DUF1819 family protein [Altibacter sp.]|uniref:DUF1819 family protein n=1 Tax=Altibacter sp. TaxID=2024823 RepID=UPI001DFD5A12|nr:DUF1819 family protein [Altibacter sp.]MBZ0328280.1 DUF1819 family protein [Altibacter sp.]